MTTVFVNGGAPTYPGSSFTSSTGTGGLLTQLESNLVTAGWTVVTSDPPNEVLKVSATDNGHTTYLNFSISDDVSTTNGKFLDVQADKDGGGTTLSSTFQLKWINGSVNTLYLSVDSAGGCLAIKSSEVKSIHFGFLDRVDVTDQNAVMIGYLDYQYRTAEIAQSTLSSTDWMKMHVGYYQGTLSTNANPNLSTSFYSIPIHTTGDRTCNFIFYNNSEDLNNKNSGFKAYNGQLNAVNNLPVIDSYYYLEGLATEDDYDPQTGQNNPKALYFKGLVRFAITGVSSLPGGSIISAVTNSNEYLSGGENGWQGFRIA